eukprot:CAMPEP_0168759212 /NCGR_PEP_ID=MMETSP0724-20121128/22102_1 /TAXON_ID=265536 /ORGANISM="Amphiprora sp., Strain CCMP467" /LENGTH=386 /DNA_ID=CAMNT_0008808119 /DNA_START=81 /DNA_END=1241 /DNA_ORIENTATION=-
MSEATGMLTALVAGALGTSLSIVWYLSLPKILPSHKKENKQAQRRLVVDKTDPDLSKVKFSVKKIAIPRPRYGQVLVKVAAIPVNPSDFNEWQYAQFQGKSFGLEGAGTVVASGGGFLAGRLVGRKVGLIVSGRDKDDLSLSHKTAAEYICVDATTACWSLPDDITLVDAAGWFVNPVTVLSILGLAKSKSIIHTGASSQLGQMLVKLAATRPGITVVNVVRRKEHVAMLQGLGAKHIICQADSDWLDQLKVKVKELNIREAFDAVAGDMTGQLLSILPKQGIVHVYGVLAGKPVGQVEPIDLIYRRKEIKGFSLSHSWIPKARFGPIGKLLRVRWCVDQVAPNLSNGDWAASQYHDVSMEQFEAEFSNMYKKGFTGKKLRIRMDQ